MTKKEIAENFSQGNFDKCFDYLTGQSFWDTAGEQYLKGKKEIEVLCQNTAAYFKSVTTHFKQFNLIENEDAIAINGTAEFLRNGERISFVSSCDIYKFDMDNNIISIHSYCITDKGVKH